MTARIFAYIVHKAGVVDDSAAELAAAAKKIDAAASPIAVVVGSGAELDAVCESLRASYSEVWKIANDRHRLSQRRAGSPGLSEGDAAGQHRAGSSQSLRNRSWRRDSRSS